MRPFNERFEEHIENLKNHSESLYVYKILNSSPESNISFDILFDCGAAKICSFRN